MAVGIDPKIDFAFKYVFGRAENSPVLIDLLKAVLDQRPECDIKELEILNPFNDQKYEADKLSILDVKVRDQAGELYNIEMQMLAIAFLCPRLLYYWSRLYSGQLH